MHLTSLGLNGAETPIDMATLEARLDAARGALVTPFSAERMDLVAGVGDAILKSKSAVSSHVKHFGFWIRKANLRALAQDFERRRPSGTVSRPRGVVFHVPPRNVETVFLYSWVLSFLTGNANVVRLSHDVSAELGGICDLFLAAFEENDDGSQFFVRYPSDSEGSRLISAQSDVRIVWGGDAKIKAFEDLPLRGGGKAIWFGDRTSLCVLDGEKVAALNGAERLDLAHRLYDDIFVFDQMACSSPHTLYVVGDAATHLSGVKALLQTLGEVASERGASWATGHQISKMVQAFASAASGWSREVSWRDAMLTSTVTDRQERADLRVGSGFLNVVFIPALDAVNGILQERDQTVTHFGFEPEAIVSVAGSGAAPGGMRWTPVGTALNFDFVWDGYDLPFELTRLVRVA